MSEINKKRTSKPAGKLLKKAAEKQTAARFDNHYSGGHGTRSAMFSMFYGLYGLFLRERTDAAAWRRTLADIAKWMPSMPVKA